MNLSPKVKEALARMGVAVATKLLEDPDYLEKYLKKYLKDVLKKSNPVLFEQQFQRRIHFVNEMDPTHVQQVRKMIVEYNLDISKILTTIRANIPRFNKDWVMDWLEKEHWDYYKVIYTHPQRIAFEMWLALQINEVANYIVRSLE